MIRSRSFEKSRRNEDFQWVEVGRLSMSKDWTQEKSKVDLNQWRKKRFLSLIGINWETNFNLRGDNIISHIFLSATFHVSWEELSSYVFYLLSVEQIE